MGKDSPYNELHPENTSVSLVCFEVQVREVIRRLRTCPEQRRTIVSDLYKLHCDEVVLNQNQDLLHVMIDSGVLEDLVDIFSSEYEAETLIVSAMLGCVITEHAELIVNRETNHAGNFLSRLLQMILVSKTDIRVGALNALRRWVSKDGAFINVLGECEIIRNAVSILGRRTIEEGERTEEEEEVGVSVREKNGILGILLEVVEGGVWKGGYEELEEVLGRLEEEGKKEWRERKKDGREGMEWKEMGRLAREVGWAIEEKKMEMEGEGGKIVTLGRMKKELEEEKKGREEAERGREEEKKRADEERMKVEQIHRELEEEKKGREEEKRMRETTDRERREMADIRSLSRFTLYFTDSSKSKLTIQGNTPNVCTFLSYLSSALLCIFYSSFVISQVTNNYCFGVIDSTSGSPTSGEWPGTNPGRMIFEFADWRLIYLDYSHSFSSSSSSNNNKSSIQFDRCDAGDTVIIEIDIRSSTPIERTMHLFINGRQQKPYGTKLPPSICFITHICGKNEFMTFVSSRRVPNPKHTHISGEESLAFQ